MFSFIHAADLHLDSPLRGLARHEGAPVNEIRGATRRAFVNLIDLAISEKVDFVLLAGDLYDGDQKSYDTALFLNQQLARLIEHKIVVFAITGNHDAESVITRSLTFPQNTGALSTRKPQSVAHPKLPVTIHGQGFATASVQENLAANYPAAVEGHFNIGLLHTSLAGSTQHDTYAPCSLEELAGKGYDYWALGHIHQPAVLQESPMIAYSGNIQGRHIRETGERGCYLVQVDDSLNVTLHEFRTLDVVRWTHLELDLASLTAADELRDLIASELGDSFAAAGDRLLAARITLTGATELHGALHSDFARWQAECHSIAASIDPEQIWIERLKLKTTPTYDPQELAKRDDLTAQVLAALDGFNPDHQPAVVAALEKKLPTAAVLELASLKEDVSAIVLHAIATSHSE